MSFSADMTALNQAVLDELESVEVTYAPAVGVPVTIQGLWTDDDAIQEADFTSLDEVGPSVVVRLSDLPVNPREDTPTITKDGQEYTVWNRGADSTLGGMMRLHLHRRDS